MLSTTPNFPPPGQQNASLPFSPMGPFASSFSTLDQLYLFPLSESNAPPMGPGSPASRPCTPWTNHPSPAAAHAEAKQEIKEENHP
jgi:hypothetical protein